MKRLVIFDLDGTLINTIADLAYSTNCALEACGFPTHREEEFRFFVGNGIDKLFERALPAKARTAENILRIRTLFLPHYNQHNIERSTPYPGIPELLRRLQDEGYSLAVASNKYQEATDKVIATLLPGISFEKVLGQRQGIPIKPDPAIVHEILRDTGAGKENTLYVGDSGVDMLTARNAGVTACGVLWGFRPQNELEEYAPRFLAMQTAEVYNALLELNSLNV